MILYSIVPAEIVFKEDTAKNNKDLIEIEYMGEKVTIMPSENNSFVIHRIISTSPKAFLNAKIQPGTIINGLNLT